MSNKQTGSLLTTSIALTTYNGMPYLQEQLDSFSRQTVLPDELIICDDGSTDESIEVCRLFSETASFKVKLVINETNLGYTKNFEKVLSMCRNDIIFISDQDDVWYNNKIEIILKEFEQTECQLIIHDLMYCNSELQSIGETKLERMRSYTNPINTYVTGMASAICNPFLKLCLPIPESISYDGWIHRCAGLIKTKHIVEVVLADYRRHETNVTINRTVNDLTRSNRWIQKRNKISKYYISKKLYKKIEINQYLVDWVKRNNQQLVSLNKKNNILKIEQSLENTIIACKQRIEIIKCINKIKKIKLAISFLIDKQINYNNSFNGVISFLKDILYTK